jgi:hypothetical protein
VGFVWALVRGSPAVRYWLILAVVSGAAIVALPVVMVYQPHYGLLLAFPFVVLAALGAEAIRRALWAVARPVGWAWVAAVVALPLPGVVSYYADGSRYDYASAAAYLRRTMGPEDRVACDSAGVLGHYLGPDRAVLALPPGGRVERLEALAADRETTWVVLASGRSGLASDVHRWLLRRARHARHVERPRLDYYRFCVDVFVIEGRVAGRAAAPATGPY